jgi:hypothetical protein
MIHQLQVSYLKEQDRILLRLNTRTGAEIRLWLTRGLLKNMYAPLVKAANTLVALPDVQAQARPEAHDGADDQALQNFKKQESLQKSDFKTPFAAQAQTFPLGPEPLLATRVRLEALESRQLRLWFEEKLPTAENGRQIEIMLGVDLLNGLMHLLDTALTHADWGLLKSPVVASKRPEPAEPPDLFALATPPQYLN